MQLQILQYQKVKHRLRRSSKFGLEITDMDQQQAAEVAKADTTMETGYYDLYLVDDHADIVDHTIEIK